MTAAEKSRGYEYLVINAQMQSLQWLRRSVLDIQSVVDVLHRGFCVPLAETLG